MYRYIKVYANSLYGKICQFFLKRFAKHPIKLNFLACHMLDLKKCTQYDSTKFYYESISQLIIIIVNQNDILAIHKSCLRVWSHDSKRLLGQSREERTRHCINTNLDNTAYTMHSLRLHSDMLIFKL